MDRRFTKVYITRADPSLPAEFWQGLYEAAPAQRREKADRLRFEKDRHLCLAADGLLRYALRENGITEYTVLLREGGKPYLQGNPLYYNLSHSGDQVLCALSNQSVGCDIQQLGTADLRLAKRFFCPDEVKWIEAATDEESKVYRFYRLWALKESYGKALGKGLSQPLNSFCFQLREGAAFLPSDPDWTFQEYSLPGYCCAVCSQSPSISQLIPVTL